MDRVGLYCFMTRWGGNMLNARWALVVVLVGCGDAAGPTLSTNVAALAVLAGGNQSDTVLATLAPITVQVRDSGGSPVAGASVSFVVTTPDCGTTFAGSALTDGSGNASELWTLGTVAGPCTMEARAVTATGTPQVFATIDATVLAGEAVTVSASTRSAWVGDGIALRDIATFSDTHGNTLNAPQVRLSGDTTALVRSGDTISSASELVASLGYVVGNYTKANASRLAWLQDLGTRAWQLTFSCSANPDPSPPPNGPPDSVAVALAVDSVVYTVQPRDGAVNTAGWLYMSGTRLEITPPDTASVAVSDMAMFFTQTVGALEWGPPATGAAVSVEPTPTTYVGGDWCDRRVVGWGGWTSASPATLSR